jgi:hypothetical protein
MPKVEAFELYSRIRGLDDRVKVCFLTSGEMYYKEIRQEAFPDLDETASLESPLRTEI